MTEFDSLSSLFLGTSFVLKSEILGFGAATFVISPSLCCAVSLSAVEEPSETVVAADGADEASVTGSIDAGNAFVGSGLSLLRERLLAFFPLSDVGLMLDGGGGAWETGGACRARSVKRYIHATLV